jgi:spoIIIJ-associated protein
VEWVEVTGKTVREAKDAALDQLGVAEDDAEFEVLEEPKPGLFGRLRSEARVRARVAPAAVRPKLDRRDRRRQRARRRPERGDGQGSERRSDAEQTSAGVAMDDGPSLEEEAEAAATFVRGLVDAFGSDGDVETHDIEEDTVEVRVTGGDLGLLIGPRGQTLAAVQELTRTAVQHRLGGRAGRLLVDVGDYRQRRREALARFTLQEAEQVKTSGQPRVLEPMSAADRKVVHDTVNTIEGVVTTSEGEEPRRYVVLKPAPPAAG